MATDRPTRPPDFRRDALLQRGDSLGEPRLRVLHTCGSSSRCTARVVVDVGHVLDRRAWSTIDSSRGAPAARAAISWAASSSCVVVDAAVHEPDPLGLGAVEHLAEEHRRHRRLRAGDAPQHPGVPAAGVDADLEEPGVELGPAGGETHVAAERQVHPGADRRTVDRGQRRQRAAGDAQEPLVDAAEAVPSASARLPRLAPAQNAARRPVTTMAPIAVVGLDRVHRGDDLGDHRRGERVALGWVVEREGGDAVGDGDVTRLMPRLSSRRRRTDGHVGSVRRAKGPMPSCDPSPRPASPVEVRCSAQRCERCAGMWVSPVGVDDAMPATTSPPTIARRPVTRGACGGGSRWRSIRVADRPVALDPARHRRRSATRRGSSSLPWMRRRRSIDDYEIVESRGGSSPVRWPRRGAADGDRSRWLALDELAPRRHRRCGRSTFDPGSSRIDAALVRLDAATTGVTAARAVVAR